MNRICTAGAAIALLLGTATVSAAQAPTQHGEHGAKGARGAGGAMGELGLSDTQKDQIKAVHARYRTQFAALRQQQHAEVRAILTTEQRARLDARRAQMRERRGQHDSLHRRGAQGDSTRKHARPPGMEGRRAPRGARPAPPPRPTPGT